MSKNVFLSGPLADPDLLGVVLGAEVPGEAALLAGVPGRVFRLSAAQADRLSYHAEVYGRVPGIVRVEIGGGVQEATGFYAGPTAPDLPMTGRWPEIRRKAAVEILSYLGSRSAAEVAENLRSLCSRADARVLAQQEDRVPESGFTRDDITVTELRRPYSKFFTVEEYVFSHRRFDGSQSPSVERAVFVAADAVTVLPYDPVRDRVLLVEQVRAAPLARGDRSPWILEPVAGRIEPGDTPEHTARKEALEEAGLDLRALIPVAGYYASTGCFSEYIHSFIGLADLSDEAARLGGVDSEDEDIRGHVMDRTLFMQRLRAGAMPDAPLLISAYWLEANLAELRGAMRRAG